MPRRYSDDAIVLRSYDVGEADRFCIVLTRSEGRLGARARGVRKMQSKMGGSLLPHACVRIDIREGSSGNLITGCTRQSELQSGMEGFVRTCAAIELLLLLLHDGEPLPDVYDLTVRFLTHEGTFEAFAVRLLTLLGLMPPAEHAPLHRLCADDTAALQRSMQAGDIAARYTPQGQSIIRHLVERIVEEHASTRLRSIHIATALR